MKKYETSPHIKKEFVELLKWYDSSNNEVEKKVDEYFKHYKENNLDNDKTI